MQNDIKIIIGSQGHANLYRSHDIKNVVIESLCEENKGLKISIVCSHHMTHYLFDDILYYLTNDEMENIMKKIVDYLFVKNEHDDVLDIYKVVGDCLK